jgi:hypothetical protein
MASGVALFALYRTETAMYGVNVALAVVATVLVVAALVLVGVAVMIGKSLSRPRASEPAEDVARSAPRASAFGSSNQAQIYSPAPSATATDSASDLIEPLAFLLGTSDIRPLDTHCSMIWSRNCESRREDRRMRRLRGRRILCGTAIGASYSYCWEVRHVSDGCLRDRSPTTTP